MSDPGQEREALEMIQRGSIGCFATDGKGYMLPSAGELTKRIAALVDAGLAEPVMSEMRTGSIALTERGRTALHE